MFKMTTLARAAAWALTGATAATTTVATVYAAPASAPTASTPAASTAITQLPSVEVTSNRQRLDTARNSLSPETGSSVYRFDKSDISKLPLGDATPLNEVLQRAPGVVGSSGGQLYVRGDHANLQYRINGVVIPESISGFGQTLSTRFADQISLITGALPAQYGHRTAGVVDIRTKGADMANVGSVDFTVGSRGHREASANIGGTSGNWQYFVTGSYLQNQIGIENPRPASNALHDETQQIKGFAYLSRLLGSSSRASLMLGSADSRFQIPNVTGESPSFTLANTTPPESQNLDARQREHTHFQVLSLQSSTDFGVDYQFSLFNRNTSLRYEPDAVGDLVYTGVAADVTRKNRAIGLQLDASYPLNAQHTLHAGLFAQRERGATRNSSTVLMADDEGAPTSDLPITITDNSRLGGRLIGAYLQDEWRPSKALTVNWGARFDQATTVTDEAQWSPRFGLVYQLSDNTRLHAGYARYFAPPSSEKIDSTSVQKFLGTSNALPSDANTAVRAERSNYFDLGVSHQLSPHITLGFDAYYRQVRHLQDEGQFGNALIYSSFNFEQGRVFGFELSSSYKNERLSGYINLALSSVKGKGIESGQFNFDATELNYINANWVNLDHAQRAVASAGVAYQVSQQTTLSADALYGSGLRRGFANTERLPGHTRVNASVVHAFTLPSLGKFELRLSALNLLDRSYLLRDGSGIGVGAPQYGARRSLYLGLSKPFAF
jgi:outer membrane receptor protein involved in Fe transport